MCCTVYLHAANKNKKRKKNRILLILGKSKLRFPLLNTEPHLLSSSASPVVCHQSKKLICCLCGNKMPLTRGSGIYTFPSQRTQRPSTHSAPKGRDQQHWPGPSKPKDQTQHGTRPLRQNPCNRAAVQAFNMIVKDKLWTKAENIRTKA